MTDTVYVIFTCSLKTKFKNVISFYYYNLKYVFTIGLTYFSYKNKYFFIKMHLLSVLACSKKYGNWKRFKWMLIYKESTRIYLLSCRVQQRPPSALQCRWHVFNCQSCKLVKKKYCEGSRCFARIFQLISHFENMRTASASLKM